MKKISSKLNNDGFTLIEVMVSAGILAVIALAVVSQLKLVGNSKMSANVDSTIGIVRSRLITELSNENTCTQRNFGTKPINNTYTVIKNSEGATIISTTAGSSQLGSQLGASVVTSNLIDIKSISTAQNPLNADEMILTVGFAKKGSLDSLFGLNQKIDIPITIISSGGIVSNCFTDATLSVATAIQLSCAGNSAYYDSTQSPPYGECWHKVQPTIPVCPAGQFLRRVGINLSGAGPTNQNSKAFEYQCAALESACPANKVISSTNADGTVTCDYPFPNCTAGQLMVKTAGGNYICLKTDLANATIFGCTSGPGPGPVFGFAAVKSFNADGSVTCLQTYPAQSGCASTGGYLTSISPDGTYNCSSLVKPKTCNIWEFISKVDTLGNPICTSYYTVPSGPCAAGQAAGGVDANGTLSTTCKPMDYPLFSGGVASTKHTWRDCWALGGQVGTRSVIGTTGGRSGAYTAPGQYLCYLPGNATHTVCSQYSANGFAFANGSATPVYNAASTCVDTNSACTGSVKMNATAPTTNTGSGYRTGGVAPWSNWSVTGIFNTVTCGAWNKISGPWQRNCTFTPTTTVQSTMVLECI